MEVILFCMYLNRAEFLSLLTFCLYVHILAFSYFFQRFTWIFTFLGVRDATLLEKFKEIIFLPIKSTALFEEGRALNRKKNTGFVTIYKSFHGTTGSISIKHERNSLSHTYHLNRTQTSSLVFEANWDRKASDTKLSIIIS